MFVFCHSASKHRHTVPLGLGPMTKLLHHCAVSSVPAVPVFLNGSCSACTMHLGRAWYGFMSSFVVNVTFKGVFTLTRHIVSSNRVTVNTKIH